LTQAPSTFLRVLVARAMPCWTASSKPFSEIALISVTVATLITSVESPLFWMLLLTTAHIFAYHLKGEAKHVGGRPMSTHQQRPIAHPDRAQGAGEGSHSLMGIMCWCMRTQDAAQAAGRGLRASGRGKGNAAPGRGPQSAAKDSMKAGASYEPRLSSRSPTKTTRIPRRFVRFGEG
jgi:hypothetical protein